jgi:hypothetical protein
MLDEATSVELAKHGVFSENYLMQKFLLSNNYWEKNNFSLQWVLYVIISTAVIFNQQNVFSVPYIIFMNLSYKSYCNCVVTYEVASSTDQFIDEVESG